MSTSTASNNPRVWLVTGCSSGFGMELVHSILARGDKVIATARSVDKLSDLLKAGAATLQLDVTSSLAELQATAEKAIAIYGKIDVLVNNAAYVLQGAIEECSPEETFQQFNTNVFGLLNVTRAFLPHMRARKSGVIVNIGSIGGFRGSAGVGLYCATKFTLEGITEALRHEVAHLGIKVTVVEPGYFRTLLLKPGNTQAPHEIADYAESAGKTRKLLEAYNGKQPGDPKKACERIVDIVTQTGTAQGREIPLRIALGTDAYGIIKDVLEKSLKNLEEWKDITVTTDHDDVKGNATH